MLKRGRESVDTHQVKLCPHCAGELRDSVIQCTHCGRDLRGEPAQAPVASGAALAPVAAATRPSGAPAPPRPRPAGSQAPYFVVAEPKGASAPVSPLADPARHRAMSGKQRSWGLDLWMLWAGMAAATAGVLAHLSNQQPWVHLTVTDTVTDPAKTRLVELTLRGDAAFVGSAASVLGIALALFGVVWFVYGLQRGWMVPSVVSPALGLLVSLAGIGMTVLSAMVWFVWEDAMVLKAARAGLTSAEMRVLLDHQPTPLVEIERQSGLMSFGGMMVLGLLAASLAWWAYRRREA